MPRDESPIVRPIPEDEDYNWTHRAILQAFQTHGVLTVDAIKAVLASILTAYNPERPWSEGDITQPQITSTIQTINARIEPFDFEIRNTREQRTKETLYALVNSTSDSLTQLATKFSPGEIAYIRRLLDYMFEINNTPSCQVMALKHAEASQLSRPSRRSRPSQFNSTTTTNMNADDDDDGDNNNNNDNTNTNHRNGDGSQAADTGITIAEADAVLTRLVNESFFQKSRLGYFSLAPRALMELRAYLKETYNETADEAEDGVERIRIYDCEGCRELVTYGIRCNRKACPVRWHDACASSYYRGKAREARKCPKCETQCLGDLYVGERADQARGRRTVGAGNTRGATQYHGEQDEDEIE